MQYTVVSTVAMSSRRFLTDRRAAHGGRVRIVSATESFASDLNDAAIRLLKLTPERCYRNWFSSPAVLTLRANEVVTTLNDIEEQKLRDIEEERARLGSSANESRTSEESGSEYDPAADESSKSDDESDADDENDADEVPAVCVSHRAKRCRC